MLTYTIRRGISKKKNQTKSIRGGNNYAVKMQCFGQGAQRGDTFRPYSSRGGSKLERWVADKKKIEEQGKLVVFVCYEEQKEGPGTKGLKGGGRNLIDPKAFILTLLNLRGNHFPSKTQFFFYEKFCVV